MTQLKIDDSIMVNGAFSIVCLRCKNLIDFGVGRKCKAFKEIPLPIWGGKNNHKKPYPGDNGIQFEERK